MKTIVVALIVLSIIPGAMALGRKVPQAADLSSFRSGIYLTDNDTTHFTGHGWGGLTCLRDVTVVPATSQLVLVARKGAEGDCTTEGTAITFTCKQESGQGICKPDLYMETSIGPNLFWIALETTTTLPGVGFLVRETLTESICQQSVFSWSQCPRKDRIERPMELRTFLFKRVP